MVALAWRVQLRLVALAYVAVLAVAVTLLYARHLQALKYPVEASGGMWAFGNTLLYLFIACLFMVPTIVLLLVIAKFEPIYIAYSHLLLGLSVSAPVCLGTVLFSPGHFAENVIVFSWFRLFWSPFILMGIGVSRLAARFDRAKRLVSYALLIEGLNLGIAIALIIRAALANGR